MNQGAVDIKVVHTSLEMLQSNNNEIENERMCESKSNFSWWSQKVLCRMSLCCYHLFRLIVICMTSLLQPTFNKIIIPISMDCFTVLHVTVLPIFDVHSYLSEWSKPSVTLWLVFMSQSKHRGFIWLSVIKHRLNEQVLETGPNPVFILRGGLCIICSWTTKQRVIKWYLCPVVQGWGYYSLSTLQSSSLLTPPLL